MMASNLKNRWVRVAFIVHCGEVLGRVTSAYEAEPAWHRLAITQALACAKARAKIGGRVDDNDSHYTKEAIVVDGQYFDPYDVEALLSAICACTNAMLNVAAEVDEPEADLFCAATAIAGLAMGLAFDADESDTVADAVSWMHKASDRHGTYAESCLESLVATESMLRLQPEEAVPGPVLDLLNGTPKKRARE